jgi:hypothetical protein
MNENLSLSYLEKKTGFIVAKVKDEIPTYEEFTEIISKYSKVRTTINDQKWYSRSKTKNLPNKLGIAKNYPVMENDEKAGFYEFAFQAKDIDKKTIISGLHKNNRPMSSFEFDYKYWKDKFFVIALGVDVDTNNLENTIKDFFDSTNLTQDKFSEKMILDYNGKKEAIIKTINSFHKEFKKFDEFKKAFCYEILQEYRLFDRFVNIGDYGV